MQMNKILFALFLAVTLGDFPAFAAEHADHGQHGAASPNAAPADMNKVWKEILAKPSLAVTADFDENGRLWLAAIRGQ